ncbi:hypothetical protein Tco_1343766 [Tanacetum coccineum]
MRKRGLRRSTNPAYVVKKFSDSSKRKEVWNDCKSCKVRVGSNGNLLWEASVLLGRKKGGEFEMCIDYLKKSEIENLMRNEHVEVTAMPLGLNQCISAVLMEFNDPDDRRDTEGREDVHEVSKQRGSRCVKWRSGAKRKLSRCGRNQMGNEPILALPEGADDFVVYYDARSKDLEACLEKGEGDCLYVATTEGSYEGLHG